MAVDGYTIGEVLNQLKEDFEDITISKIRFLESEGLVTPDRTQSGYRKFSDDDVDRLRFILTAQREHYLPLKVIREQLERLDAGGTAPTPAPRAAEPAPPEDAAEADAGEGQPADLARLLQQAVGAGEGPGLEAPPAHITLSLPELYEATGLTAAQVRSLRDFGILGERGDDGQTFGGDDVLAGRAAKELLNLGLEPRHLRMYRQFADRELGLFEQLVTPLLRQRHPEARRQATRQLEKMAAMTGQMQRSLLARALRQYVHGA